MPCWTFTTDAYDVMLITQLLAEQGAIFNPAVNMIVLNNIGEYATSANGPPNR